MQNTQTLAKHTRDTVEILVSSMLILSKVDNGFDNADFVDTDTADELALRMMVLRIL